jgi:diguanylate cyclase (GGDEF)-like protein
MLRGQFGVLKVFILRAEPGEKKPLAVTVPSSGALAGAEILADEGFGKLLVEESKPVTGAALAASAAIHPAAAALCEGGVEVVVPLVHSNSDGGKELVGAIGLGAKIRKTPFTEADQELLSVLSNLVAVALSNAQLYHRSIVDGLTKVYSRGHFDAHLVQEVSRARRHQYQAQNKDRKEPPDNTKLSLVMIDIDHFKSVNDNYGHQTGDAVLRSVGALLKECVRTMDIVSRYGGEEFAVVFPETSRDDAMMIAERLREGFETLTCQRPDGSILPVTASFGVATWPDDADDVRELVAAADAALYRAKETGRNRVVSAGGSSAGAPEPRKDD